MEANATQDNDFDNKNDDDISNINFQQCVCYHCYVTHVELIHVLETIMEAKTMLEKYIAT